MKRVKGFDWKLFLTPENEYRIWHFFYSVKKQEEFKKGINSLFEKLLTENKFSLEYKDALVKNFITFGGYTNDYGTYSEKALKKLLPFLRIGKYWSSKNIEVIFENRSQEIKDKDNENIIKISKTDKINGELTDFQGMWISNACYLVYDRYSEVGDIQYWKTPYDIDNFLRNEFKQHSLNNPVVERVLVETLQLVKDIWKYYGEQDGIDGNGNIIYKKLFNRIHIELGREMKKNAKEKERENRQNNDNKKTNERIIELLKELQKENNDVRTKSPFQQEKLRILEDGLLSSIEFDKDATIYQFRNSDLSITKKEIKDITSKDIVKISKSDFERYKLWLDQRYRSPYTGEFIKLSDLFNREKYEIEHIFPQERITLNAFYNKVICETEVNKAKKAFTAYQFILNCKGERIIKCAAHNKDVRILNTEAYESLVKSNFTDKRKQEILLSKEIPDDFTNSQLNNSKYIAKMTMKLLSNIVREEGEDSFRSKHVLPINGIITTRLKNDWQLNDAWNELIQPRFERLNTLTNSNLFGNYENINGHNIFINRVPEELNKDFNKKRIDHRHHAMDALVIALATENHVNYLNNIYSKDNNDDKFEARIRIKNRITDTRKNEDDEKSRFFLPPAQIKEKGIITEYKYEYANIQSKVFKDIALQSLQNTIVSFKQKKRLIKQRTNKFEKWNIEKKKFELISEERLNNKENYNIRLALHKATYYGKVKLKLIKEVSIENALENINNIENKQLKSVIKIKQKDGFKNKDIVKYLESFKDFSNKIDLKKIKIYYWDIDEKGEGKKVATRYENFLESFAEIKANKILQTIGSITDTGIQKILFNHLNKYNELREDNNTNTFHPEIAFSFDGVKELNGNIKVLNDGKDHKPIYKVRISTPLGTKFPVSEDGFKNTKYVITSADSNVFCGFYENGYGERKFYVPTLRETVENLKKGYKPCKDKIVIENIDKENCKKNEFDFIFELSPNDLVFVPNAEERISPILLDFKNLNKDQKSRIYKFTDGNSDGVMNFVPVNIASTIVDVSKDEYKKINLNNLTFEETIESKKGIRTTIKELVNEIGLGSTQSKNQNSLNSIQIKAICWKLKIDRLGNIIEVNNKSL